MLIAVLGGAAAGAAATLLLAPRSGRETRAQLSEFVNNSKDKARHLPPAVKAGATAARKAFVETMHEEVPA
ncbi:MAG: YtxH domain-containing protein [Gemmatimonadota bacterium]|nr:YtxH domain-containing protein [Gemmatimonadota bacterium]